MTATTPSLDLDQARRRAKELLSAARTGEADAVRRVRRRDPRLADAQHAVAREHGYDSWADLVRDHESFLHADVEEVDWRRIREAVVLCFPATGELMLHRAGDRWATPRGRLGPGEDAWDDGVLRLCLEAMAFRRQGTHLLATDRSRRTAVFFVDGAGGYRGRHAHHPDPVTWSGPAAEAVALLRGQGDGALARLVEWAAREAATMSYERHRRDLRRTLTGAYLGAPTLAGGSGFGGSEVDWRGAREPLTEALDGLAARLGRPDAPVSLMDVGCANGHLVASMVRWGAELGVSVEPYGIDHDPALVARAIELHPHWADRFWTGDATTWVPEPQRRFDLVHLLLDVLPDELHRPTIRRWFALTSPGGRLLISNYDAREERSAEHVVRAAGFTPDGRTTVPIRRSTGAPYHLGSVWLDA